MSLKETLAQDLKLSMKEKDTVTGKELLSPKK